MGAFSFGFGAGRARRRLRPGNAGFRGTVDATGWQLAIDEGRPRYPATIVVSQPGFDEAGNPVRHQESLTALRSLRRLYPDHELRDPTRAALSEPILAEAEIAGHANQSARVSPLPIANWTMPARLVCGSTCRWEIAAYHCHARSGRQVAAVRVRGNDGLATTPWQVVASSSLSTLCEGLPIEVFAGTLDITALGDQRGFWLEAEVFPWLGTQASVLRSEDVFAEETVVADRKRFSRRYFRKDIARAAAPACVYVSPTGSDAAGIVSTDPLAAAASPCLTVAGALARARASLGATRGALDGLRIRIAGTVNFGGPSGIAYQDWAAVVIERAPNTLRSQAVVTLNQSATLGMTDHTAPGSEGALLFRDVTFALGGNFSLTGAAANWLHVAFWNATIDLGGYASSMRSNSAISIFGATLRNMTTGNLGASTNGRDMRIIRGVSGDLAGSSLDGYFVVGCDLVNASTISPLGTYGAIVAGNRFAKHKPGANKAVLYAGTAFGEKLAGIAIAGNVFEKNDATDAVCLQIAGDNAYGDLVHAVIHHNTIAGAYSLFRINFAYDDRVGFPRDHGFVSVKGNIAPQWNSKGDVFRSDAIYDGNLAVDHGVFLAGNFIEADSAVAPAHAFQPDHPGIGSVQSGGDAGFVARKGVGWSWNTAAPLYTPGAGGGDYALVPGSAARGIVPDKVRSFDLAGRPIADADAYDAGAYQD